MNLNWGSCFKCFGAPHSPTSHIHALPILVRWILGGDAPCLSQCFAIFPVFISFLTHPSPHLSLCGPPPIPGLSNPWGWDWRHTLSPWGCITRTPPGKMVISLVVMFRLSHCTLYLHVISIQFIKRISQLNMIWKQMQTAYFSCGSTHYEIYFCILVIFPDKLVLVVPIFPHIIGTWQILKCLPALIPL